MPISALAGKAEYMDVLEDVFFSGTHGGEALSLAAARATLDVMRRRAACTSTSGGWAASAGRAARADRAHGLDGW